MSFTPEPRPRDDREPTTYNLLYVCTGNTCRSPLAAAISKRALRERGWSHVRVASAGIATQPGAAATDYARLVAAEDGIDLDSHQSQSITPELLDWADLILAMSPSHLLAVSELGAGDKAALVTDFLEDDDLGTPVDDPFGGEPDQYRQTYHQLERAIDALLSRLEPILSP
jgi:protein-tyrosine-phosphatase